VSEDRQPSERTTGPLLGPDILVSIPANRTLSDDIPSDDREPSDTSEAAYPEQPGPIRRLVDRLLRRR
jgi:hypothetical protein